MMVFFWAVKKYVYWLVCILGSQIDVWTGNEMRSPKNLLVGL
jgi:hypothetical protein